MTLDATFSALSDPTRRAILMRLMQGEASVNDLAKPFALSQPTISKHIKVLETAGLIERRRDAQFRPCRLNPSRLEEAWLWIGDYQRFWQESFDRLGVFAEALHRTEKADKKKKKEKEVERKHGKRSKH